MGSYKIKINVGIEDMSTKGENNDIYMDLEIDEESACSIDKIEKALLRVNREAIRAAISAHLEEISKKSSN